MWTKTFGGIFEDEGTVIIETIDKVFVVGGHKGDNVYDSTFVLGLNSIGDILWSSVSCYGNPGEFVIPDLYESASGDYVMGFGFFDNGLLRVYSNGDSVQYYWRHHPSRRGPRLHHICKTSNDNYVLSYVADFTCLLLEKVDSSGNELWSKFYRYYANSHVIQSDDGEFAIISDKWSEIAGGWLGLVLLKVNADGNILWTNVVYKDSIPNYTIRITNKCLTEVSGGGYLILANENGEKIWLFRTDELGDHCGQRNTVELELIMENILQKHLMVDI